MSRFVRIQHAGAREQYEEQPFPSIDNMDYPRFTLWPKGHG